MSHNCNKETCAYCMRLRAEQAEARVKVLEEEVAELRIRDRIAYGPRPESAIQIMEMIGPTHYEVGGSGAGGTGAQQHFCKTCGAHMPRFGVNGYRCPNGHEEFYP